MTRLLVDADDEIVGLDDGVGLLGLAGAGPGAVSLHCCHSQASPSRIGLRGGGGGGGGVVVRLAFGVTTTWLSKAYEVIRSIVYWLKHGYYMSAS